jgi:cell division protein FtsL
MGEEAALKADNHYEDLAVSRQRLLKKIPNSQKGMRNLISMVLFLCMSVCIAFFHVWIRVEVVRVGYEISSADQRRRELRQSHEWLKIMIASLRSPERIELIARSKLGLRPPERSQIRWLK